MDGRKSTQNEWCQDQIYNLRKSKQPQEEYPGQHWNWKYNHSSDLKD